MRIMFSNEKKKYVSIFSRFAKKTKINLNLLVIAIAQNKSKAILVFIQKRVIDHSKRIQLHFTQKTREQNAQFIDKLLLRIESRFIEINEIFRFFVDIYRVVFDFVIFDLDEIINESKKNVIITENEK